jgi:hypothetical protein
VAKQLIVILGAGASYDCVSDPGNPRHNHLLRPPLVRDLFGENYRAILDKYPLAQAAAAGLWPHIAAGDQAEVSLEDYLRKELLESEAPHLRAQYWAVPLYLQDLLHACGLEYTKHPDAFDRLVTSLLHLDRVVFVTLNYDTIFDRVLQKYQSLDSLDSYTSDRRVALIKLHGSVNWGRRVDTTAINGPTVDGYLQTCHALAANPDRLSEEVILLAKAPGPSGITELRFAPPSGDVYYPALAAPLGPNDEPVCPPNHVEALRQSLDQQSYGYDLHVLIIGYSCLDRTPLDLIKNSGSAIKSLVMVNGSEDAGQTALGKMQEHMPGVAPREDRDHIEVFDGGFAKYATPLHLTRLVDRIRAA